MTYPDGGTYVGQFENGMPHGQGTITRPDGQYTGQFKFGKKNGHGTVIFANGSNQHLFSKDFQIEVLDKWKSSKTGATYPSQWRIKVPAHQIELTLTPTVKDQELITEASTRVTYWEGSVKVDGRYRGGATKGLGYVEMTGYAKPFSKGI